MYCTKCGQSISDGTNFCLNCGKPESQYNLLVIYGFICSVVGLLLPIPVIDFVISGAGAVLCLIGIQKPSLRVLGIIGAVIGVLGFVIGLGILITDPGFYSDMWKDIATYP